MCTCARLVVSTLCDPWSVSHQAPLSTGFSRQEYWSGLPFPPPGDLPDPGIEPMSLESLELSRWILYQLHHLGLSHDNHRFT